MKNKPRCKQCRKIIQPGEETQQLPLNAQVHIKDCLDKYTKNQLAKVRKRKEKAQKEFKKAKEQSNLSKTKQTAWTYFSQYIRLRDANNQGIVHCISCNKPFHWKNGDAGHYIPKSLGAFFYFNEDNVRFQCRRDNSFNPDKAVWTAFRENLVRQIGEKRVKELEDKKHNPPFIKTDLAYYEKLKDKYRKKFNELKKQKT